MKRTVKIYLKILPYYSLVGIVLSIFRTAYQNNFAEVFLLFGAILDLFVVFHGRNHLKNRTLLFVSFLLVISCLVGLINNNELSRRYITDFTNPFFFFSKILIFRQFWRMEDFDRYLVYYRKIALYGSLLLLPITYFLFRSAGVTRLAIFPPMELPFAFFMQQGGLFFLLSLIIILLYGKRAQFVSGIITFFLFVVVFKRDRIFKYAIIAIAGIILLRFTFSSYQDNVAISRLMATMEQLTESESDAGAVEDVGGSRAVEVTLIMKEMDGALDYLFGKGLGYTYRFEFNSIDKINANAHFTPVALLSKYGIVFTVFIYYFLLSTLFVNRKRLFTTNYIAAVGTCLFVFFESFFAYALFILPIFPVVFGYVLKCQHDRTKSIPANAR